jgi:NTP pyrophosphatase (non-canonical NTP hydrolase)
MQFENYQRLTGKTAIYPQNIASLYLALGVNGEAGEIAEIIKKAHRDDKGHITIEAQAALAKEIGDCLWYLSELCTVANLSLDACATTNIQKLADRAARGKLHGSGDER